MSDTPPPFPTAAQRQLITLSRALRFAACAMVLALSCLNIPSAFAIEKFMAIFNDMLAGKPLPAVTAIIVTLRMPLVFLSVLIPAAAIALLFVRSLVAPVYVSVGLAMVALGQVFVTVVALFLPLLDVVRNMTPD
jgi:hypothetical protein